MTTQENLILNYLRLTTEYITLPNMCPVEEYDKVEEKRDRLMDQIIQTRKDLIASGIPIEPIERKNRNEGISRI
ncbi:hypothetical protein ACWG0P_10840 [Amedibacillus sp. YH-ame6]